MNNDEHNAKIKRLAEISRQTDRAHRKLFEKHAVEAFGIHRSQHMMLMYISKNKDVSQRQIAENFNISAAAVAVTLKKLESMGFVEREASQSDSRRNHIRVSQKGMCVIDETKHIVGAIDRLMFDGFSEDEMQQLRAFSERMFNNLIKAESVTTEELKGDIDETVV